MQRESRHHEALLAVLRRIRTDLGTPRAPDAPAAATRFVTIDSAGTLLVPDVASAATVLIGSTGEVVGIETATRSVHPAVDSALLAGVRAASGSSELAVLASSLGAERLRVTLFTTLVRAGARPPQGALVAYHDVVLPAYRGTPATLAPGAKGAPYPESARQAGIQGDVLSSFTISAAGAMEPGSLLAIRSAAPELERAVAAWLPTLAYRPATIGGCAVRVRVQQPTRFTLHR
jgi:TonB family protein